MRNMVSNGLVKPINIKTNKERLFSDTTMPVTSLSWDTEIISILLTAP
jgi:hypothetical protein